MILHCFTFDEWLHTELLGQRKNKISLHQRAVFMHMQKESDPSGSALPFHWMGWCDSRVCGSWFVKNRFIWTNDRVLPVPWYCVGVTRSSGLSRRVISCKKANSAYICGTIPSNFYQSTKEILSTFSFICWFKNKNKNVPFPDFCLSETGYCKS